MTGEIVVPGEELGEGSPGRNVYERGGALFSCVYGFLTEGEPVSVIPVREKYIPSEGDQVVGVVTGVKHASWGVDIKSPYPAVLHISRVDRELTQGALDEFLAPGDAFRAVVDEIEMERDPELSLDCGRCGPLRSGRVLEVEPARVPRLIGRDGDMVRTFRSLTGADVFVGNNGRVWIEGDKGAERRAAAAVEFVVENAHKEDLTEKVKVFVEELR